MMKGGEYWRDDALGMISSLYWVGFLVQVHTSKPGCRK
jgi:hypothetical protein